MFGKYYNDAGKLLKKMTLEEKIGQLFLVRYDVNTSSKYITNYYAGGFVLFAKDFQDHTKASIKKELSEKQNLSKIPLALASGFIDVIPIVKILNSIGCYTFCRRVI